MSVAASKVTMVGLPNEQASSEEIPIEDIGSPIEGPTKFNDHPGREDVGETTPDINLTLGPYEALIMQLLTLVPETPIADDLHRQIEDYFTGNRSDDQRVDEVISILALGARALSEPYYLELRVLLLGIIGQLYMDRSQRLGGINDVEMAIEYKSQVVLLIPDDHEKRAATIGSLGILHESRFNHLGELADIDKAVEYMAEMVLLTPDGHANKTIWLGNLGSSHRSRFQHLGELSDVDKAIEYQTQAVSLTPDGHPDKPAWLGSLALSYNSRFERLGELPDVNKAIEYQLQAVSLTPDGHADKASQLGNLGGLYNHRFDRLGELVDINKAIECNTQAMLLTPDGDTGKPAQLSSLGNSYNARFARLGEVADIEKAIEYNSQSVLLIPDGHAGKPALLNNLGISYATRFERLGELADCDKAIEHKSQAILLTVDGHTDKPIWLGNLGISHKSRFERLGELPDIDKAIEYQSQAVLSTPDGHADKPIRLGTLGSSYESRFERLGELPDVDKAIECLNQAVLLTPGGHAERPKRLISLGSSYNSRFERLGELSDINKAIEYKNQAVLLTPDGHAYKPTMLNNLGTSYETRFQRLEELKDVDKAIECQTRALLLTPDGHADKPMRLSTLGSSHNSRFESLGELPDIQRAIECHSQAVLLTPGGHVENPKWLSNLGISYQLRFKRLGNNLDIKQCIDYFKEAAQSPAGHPSTKLKASLHWARQSFLHHTASSLEAYKQVMALVPEVVWLGATVGRRYENIKSEVQSVAVEAAAAAISLKEHDRALEWLEQGRSIVWNQLIQLRAVSLQDLAAVDALLADELRRVARELDDVGSLQSIEMSSSLDAPSIEQVSRHRRRLAAQWEQLVLHARNAPGLLNFLQPKHVEDFASAACTTTIVVINVHESRCDALALLPGSTTALHIPLPSLSYGKVAEIRAQILNPIRHADVRAHNQRRPHFYHPQTGNQLETVLAILWVDLVKPVLEGIGYLQPASASELPRVTWCTTGPLAFLPLHAAGCYNEPRSRIFDYVVSSYTPTLSALLKPSLAPAKFSGILAVGQETTSGFPRLPGTVAELDQIQKLASNVTFTRLDGDRATFDAVLAAMEQHSWVHLACHASQNTADPTRSAFHLHDKALDLAKVTRKSLKHPEFAFLSACETASGDDKLPDEAVHLAAGIIMAGYPSVIGTMWAIEDKDAPLVAEKVYAHMLEGGIPDAGKAARALHLAVGCLREKVGEKSFARWVPYVHIGQ